MHERRCRPKDRSPSADSACPVRRDSLDGRPGLSGDNASLVKLHFAAWAVGKNVDGLDILSANQSARHLRWRRFIGVQNQRFNSGSKLRQRESISATAVSTKANCVASRMFSPKAGSTKVSAWQIRGCNQVERFPPGNRPRLAAHFPGLPQTNRLTRASHDDYSFSPCVHHPAFQVREHHVTSRAWSVVTLPAIARRHERARHWNYLFQPPARLALSGARPRISLSIDPSSEPGRCCRASTSSIREPPEEPGYPRSRASAPVPLRPLADTMPSSARCRDVAPARQPDDTTHPTPRFVLCAGRCRCHGSGWRMPSRAFRSRSGFHFELPSVV